MAAWLGILRDLAFAMREEQRYRSAGDRLHADSLRRSIQHVYEVLPPELRRLPGDQAAR